MSRTFLWIKSSWSTDFCRLTPVTVMNSTDDQVDERRNLNIAWAVAASWSKENNCSMRPLFQQNCLGLKKLTQPDQLPQSEAHGSVATQLKSMFVSFLVLTAAAKLSEGADGWQRFGDGQNCAERLRSFSLVSAISCQYFLSFLRLSTLIWFLAFLSKKSNNFLFLSKKFSYFLVRKPIISYFLVTNFLTS